MERISMNMQTLTSIDFNPNPNYFQIIRFREDEKDEQIEVHDKFWKKGEKQEYVQEQLEEEAVDFDLFLHLTKVQ